MTKSYKKHGVLKVKDNQFKKMANKNFRRSFKNKTLQQKEQTTTVKSKRQYKVLKSISPYSIIGGYYRYSTDYSMSKEQAMRFFRK